MARDWTVTVRNGPHVEHDHCESLEATIELIEQRVEELSGQAHRDEVKVLKRRYEAAQQVPVRIEIAGPGGLLGRPRAGVDLRGDGSVEPFTGRLRRLDVALSDGESPYDGLRRVLGGAA